MTATAADQEAANRHKSSVRSKVEHPIGTINPVFGSAKARYRGVAKSANRMLVDSARTNPFALRRRLLRAAV